LEDLLHALGACAVMFRVEVPDDVDQRRLPRRGVGADVLDRAGIGFVDAPDVGIPRTGRRGEADNGFARLAHEVVPFGERMSRALARLPSQRPKSMAGTKASVPGARRGRAVSAGPGQ